MKKFFAFLLAAMLCLTLVACGNNEEKPTGDNNDVTPSGNVTVSKDYFEWSQTDDKQIIGYTELGLKQKEIAIPEECTSVQGLENNTTVQYIEFKNPDTVILSNTFRNSTSLVSVKLPDNLTVLDDSAFNGCTSLKNITIPENVTEIGSNVFLDCTSLEDCYCSRRRKDYRNLCFCTL